jgi:hypothetical protein
LSALRYSRRGFEQSDLVRGISGFRDRRPPVAGGGLPARPTRAATPLARSGLNSAAQRPGDEQRQWPTVIGDAIRAVGDLTVVVAADRIAAAVQMRAVGETLDDVEATLGVGRSSVVRALTGAYCNGGPAEWVRYSFTPGTLRSPAAVTCRRSAGRPGATAPPPGSLARDRIRCARL